MPTHIQLRRGTAQEWTDVNPILAEGELCVELDTEKFKIGNGVDYWNDLSYSSGPAGPKGDTGTQINKVIDIPDVNSSILVNGSLLVYNQNANRWDTQIGLTSQDIDAGEF